MSVPTIGGQDFRDRNKSEQNYLQNIARWIRQGDQLLTSQGDRLAAAEALLNEADGVLVGANDLPVMAARIDEATADATDLPTAIALVNSLKTLVNAMLQDERDAGLRTP